MLLRHKREKPLNHNTTLRHNPKTQLAVWKSNLPFLVNSISTMLTMLPTVSFCSPKLAPLEMVLNQQIIIQWLLRYLFMLNPNPACRWVASQTRRLQT